MNARPDANSRPDTSSHTQTNSRPDTSCHTQTSRRSQTRLARAASALGALLAVVVLAACGSSSGGAVSTPVIAPARVFALGGFEPSGTVVAGRPTTVSFTVLLPDGKPLTTYKTGPGPHTGVHLIIVPDDLANIIHEHPPITPTGLLRQTVTFPSPGPYRVLVDLYPNLPGGEPMKLGGRIVTAPFTLNVGS